MRYVWVGVRSRGWTTSGRVTPNMLPNQITLSISPSVWYVVCQGVVHELVVAVGRKRMLMRFQEYIIPKCEGLFAIRSVVIVDIVVVEVQTINGPTCGGDECVCVVYCGSVAVGVIHQVQT